MGYFFACNKRAQGAKEFRNVQELRKQIKIENWLTQYLNTCEPKYGSGTPWNL